MTKKYPYEGNEYTLRELSEMSGIGLETLRSRIYKYGWSIEDLVSTPVGGLAPHRPTSAADAKILPEEVKLTMFAYSCGRCNAK